MDRQVTRPGLPITLLQGDRVTFQEKLIYDEDGQLIVVELGPPTFVPAPQSGVTAELDE